MRLCVGIIVLFVLLQACAHRPSRPAARDVTPFLVNAGRQPVTEGEFLHRAHDVDFILIGEAHDNPCDHEQQAKLVRLLGEHKRIGSVGFEMLAVDQQESVDRLNSGELRATDRSGVLDWERRWGVPFALYAPIFDAASQHGLKVVPLNAPPATVKKVRTGGLDSLTGDEARGITPRITPPPPEQEAMLREAMAAHSHHSTSGHMGPMWEQFVRVQSFWDSQMAFAAIEARRREQAPIALIAGVGHVEHGWGIAHRLRQFEPSARILLIIPVRPAEDVEPSAADFFFTCPAMDSQKAVTSSP